MLTTQRIHKITYRNVRVPPENRGDGYSRTYHALRPAGGSRHGGSAGVGGLGAGLAQRCGPPGELLEHDLGVLGGLRVEGLAVLEICPVAGEGQPLA